MTDGQGATSTDTVVIFIDADDDPAVITGMFTGGVTEDLGPSTVDDRLTVDDPEGENLFVEQPDTPGTPGRYGTFGITNGSSGSTGFAEWIYRLDNASTITNALAAGEEVTDVFTVETVDGTTAIVTITVTGTNDPPTAEAVALPSSSAPADTTVTLSGTGSSDPEEDSDDLTYAWMQFSGPDVMLDNANTSMATFIAPELTASTALSFRLTVTDSERATATATEVVVVRAVDAPPLISIAAGTSPVIEGTAATFTLTASPAPASALTVLVTVTEEGDFIEGVAPTSVTITAATTTVTLTVRTTDDSTDEADGAITVTVGTGTGYAVNPTNNNASVTVEDNDAAPPSGITGGFTGAVTERGESNPGQIEIATGTLVLASGTFIEQTGTSSTYGSFDLGTDGAWTYTLDNDDDDTNALAEGTGAYR